MVDKTFLDAMQSKRSSFQSHKILLGVDWNPIMRNSWLITDEHVATAQQWREDWLLHIETFVDGLHAHHQSESRRDQIKDDSATNRLKSVRKHFGVVTEQWLIMLLIDNLEVPIVTQILYPELSKSAGRHALFNTFYFMLDQLTQHYDWMKHRMH